MAVSCCVLPFSATLGRLPLDRDRWREALRALPKQCPSAGQCSPGGCQKLCAAYASGEWLRRSKEPKQDRPPKVATKGKR